MVPTGVVLALTVVAANELADAIAGRAAASAAARPPAPALPAPPGRRRARPTRPPSLEVRDLTVAVDDGPALVTGVSFALRPGRVLGLVGESGCGKTMTARSLLGLLPDGVSVTGGSILWQGRELAGLPEKELNAVRGRGDRDDLPGADGRPRPDVLRRATSWPSRSAGSAASAAPRRGGSRPSCSARSASSTPSGCCAATRTSCPAAWRSGSHRAGAHRASRSCSSPTSRPPRSTSPCRRRSSACCAALVRDTGLSVVIVSHDLGVVADICDDVAVMYAGEVVESGTAAARARRARPPVHHGAARGEPARRRRPPVPVRLASIPGTVPAPAPGRPAAGSPAAARSPTRRCTGRSPRCRRTTGTARVLCIRVGGAGRRATRRWDAPSRRRRAGRRDHRDRGVPA